MSADSVCYQVYYTNDDGLREYTDMNHDSEVEAQEEVDELINQGYRDVNYEEFVFTIRDMH